MVILEENLKKYAERAADVLAEFQKHEKSNLKSPEEAAEEMLESEKDLKSIEGKFNLNSMDILYNYIKVKYPKDGSSHKVEKLLNILKVFSEKKDEKSVAESKAVYQQLVLEIKKLEDDIIKTHSEYQRKFT